MNRYMIRIILCGACVLLLPVAGCTAATTSEPKAEPKKEVQEPVSTVKPAEDKIPAKPTYFQMTVDACAAGKIPASPAEGDGLEVARGWKTADWADLAICKHFKDRRNGRNIMYLATGGGDKGKCAAVLFRRAQLDSAGKARMQVFNNGTSPVQVALALWSGEKYTYYESPVREISVGKWQEVAFDLGAGDYKTAASKWEHKASLEKDAPMNQLAVLMYHSDKLSRVLIDGLTIDTRKTPEPKENTDPKQ